MKNTIDSWRVQCIMNEWVKEINKEEDVFYNIIKKKIFVYSDRLGDLIGRGGERIDRYKARLQETGVSQVSIVQVENARIPEYTYGMDVCPLIETGGKCYDYDRLGTTACGICGADKELAVAGQQCFLNGIKNMMKN